MKAVDQIATMTTTTTLKSRGRIRYSPTNNGKIERRDGGTTKWWVVIDVDPEIGRYYRELYRLSHYKTQVINRPAWDAHISIIANEVPPDQTAWRKHERRWINFEYLHQPLSNGLYVWLPVICEEALDLREELGLKRNPYHPLHLTIGNNKDDEWNKKPSLVKPAVVKDGIEAAYREQ